VFRVAVKKFARSCGGSVLPTFAIAFIPLFIAMGGVVDYTNAFDKKEVVQDAMDSAALAAGKKIGLLTMAELQQDVDHYYTSNIGDAIAEPPPLTTSVNVSTITLTTDLHVPTYFLGIIGLHELVFHLKSQATLALGTLEVVMVLDNSGSMNTNNNIATLRQAATNLSDTLYGLGATSTKPDPVKVGLVPFAAAVNIGSQYENDASATWLDKTGIGTYAADSMDGSTNNVNPLTLINDMNNTSWGGCVEMRPMPYDVTDDTPTSTTPDTMIVPMFAPDMPDNLTCSGYYSGCSSAGSYSSTRYNGAPSGNQSYNNYLPDFPSSQCGSSSNANWTCANGSANCGGSGIGKSETQAYQRTCKYDSATPANITVGGIPGGPNFMCTTTTLMPLTTNQGDVTTAISNMIAQGATNLQSGLMWGWRALSPGEPLTQGRAYTVTDNQKILILMTDGENTYYPNSSFLKSWYGAWGFISKGHLGTTSTNQSYEESKMDERTALACQNVKAAGITVYTVAFTGSGGIPQSTQDMLQACATDPSMYYLAADQTALLSAFHAIGDQITLLRISQ
jgi:Mg-chelatase subunit ChlD